ncbi:MAG: hypothetical protein RL625_1355, partial [Gemmatimonadota bacterium]
LAEIVRALAPLPGALGVSAATAATLVEFLPELRSVFPAAEARSVDAGDRLRRRQEALLDLIAAVAERRAVSLLIDDAHQLDAPSLTALQAVPRLRGVRFLMVLAGWTPVLKGTEEVEVLELPPLSTAEVRQLVERVAPWPAGAWVPAFFDRLTATSRGLPQVVIQIVRTLLEEGVLSLAGDVWSVANPERLLERVDGASVLPVDRAAISETGRLLLRILSVWGRPMPDVALRAIAQTLASSVTSDVSDATIERLEALGVVVSRGSEWSIAHDTIAEALREGESPANRQRVREAAVRWWVSQPEVDLPTLEHLMLLCAEGDDLQSARAAVAKLTRDAEWRRTQRLSAGRLANRLASAAGRPDWERPLYGSMGWVARRSRTQLAWLSAGASAILLSGAVLAALLWPRLRVEVEPMGESYLPQRLATLQVQPRVGVYDGFGRRLLLSGEVRAEAEGIARTIGDTVISLREGRAQFRRLALANIAVQPIGEAFTPQPHRIRFRGPGWVLGTSAPVHGMIGVEQEGIRVVELSVNGRAVDSTLRVTLPVGEPLHFVLTLSYTTAGITSNYIVGAGPTWLPPKESVIRLAGLPRPVIDAWQTVEFDVPPASGPGHHHLLILFRAEDSVEHLFSATNWAVGTPVWGDGNDLAATLTEGQITQLRRDGQITIDRYLMRQYLGRRAQGSVNGVKIQQVLGPLTPVYQSTPIIGTAIEIDFVVSDR